MLWAVGLGKTCKQRILVIVAVTMIETVGQTVGQTCKQRIPVLVAVTMIETVVQAVGQRVERAGIVLAAQTQTLVTHMQASIAHICFLMTQAGT